ncbi:DUF3604 domain-containing protein [Ruegeria faecimaris]|uniref:DUF3604 domain-containing protein n=1 Tax=Ruegeria faecimaris TaxID=686389 RepID=UPI0031F15870
MVPENPIKNAYFGETHVYTSFSLDAFIGSARLTPSDAYRFAKGQPVSVNNVQRRIGRPLDFAAISVHAEFLGEMLSTQIPSAPGHYQEAAGSTPLAIPHNSNGSKGLMFEPIDNAGNPITREYAERRAKWEPLIEMMQIKGNSETHPGVSPNDEFANFVNAESIAAFSERFFRTDGFVRWAATKGLDYEQKLGANPWKLGFIGGTDNHNGTPSDVDEATYNGSHGVADGTIEQRREGEIDGWLLGPTPTRARSQASGRPRTHLVRFLTRCKAAKPSPHQALGYSRVSLAVQYSKATTIP